MDSVPRKNILVIEDDSGVSEALESLFEDAFNVFIALDGGKGLELFRTVPIDLVTLDMRLPGMDGTEVLRNIRQSSKTVPVIVLTAHSTIERAERCADLGVQGYIRKPYDCDDLLDRVREILNENEGGEDKRTNQTEYAFAELSNPVQECLRFIDSHCTEPIRQKDVAAEVCPKVLLSKNYLGKMFKKEMGRSIDEHINRLRIQKSKEILVKDGDVKVLQLYEQLGFKDESVFLRYFKKYENMTPTDFRRSNENLAFRSAGRQEMSR